MYEKEKPFAFLADNTRGYFWSWRLHITVFAFPG